MTDAQRAGKGMGIDMALGIIGEALVDADNNRCASAYGLMNGINERRLTEQQALATLAAKLRAADALAEAALECMDAGVDQATAQVNTQKVELRLVSAEKNLTAALAAYKQAGMGGESSDV